MTRVERLTRERAAELSERLLAMTADSSWDTWDRENLLSSRPEKWALSLLALDGDRPVGWAVASRTTEGTHLHHIVVDPEHRSRGIGRMLIDQLLVEAEPGVLTLKVHPDNGAAARLYARLGFEEHEPTPSGYRRFSRPARRTEERQP